MKKLDVKQLGHIKGGSVRVDIMIDGGSSSSGGGDGGVDTSNIPDDDPD